MQMKKASTKSTKGDKPLEIPPIRVKKKKIKEPPVEVVPERTDWANHERSIRELKTMKRRDIQTACVMRGLPFSDVSGFDQLQIIAWFQNNYERPQDASRIPEYDTWVDKELELRGYGKGKSIRNPIFNLGIRGNLDGEKPKSGGVKAPLPGTQPQSLPKVAKPPREKNEVLGLSKGTKKEMTYLLTREGKTPEEVTAAVTKAFPEAQPKSIRIWMGRCKKDMKNEQ